MGLPLHVTIKFWGKLFDTNPYQSVKFNTVNDEGLEWLKFGGFG